MAENIATTRPVRCAPCQLQLCKGRGEPPHAGLKEISSAQFGGGDTTFTCQTCSISMVRSADMSAPGWRHQR